MIVDEIKAAIEDVLIKLIKTAASAVSAVSFPQSRLLRLFSASIDGKPP